MPLESFSFIAQLNAAWPIGASDIKGQGDDHLRGLKDTLQNSFPNIDAAVTLTPDQLNQAAIKDEANIFVGGLQTPAAPVMALQGTRPIFVLDETDATADEGKWYIHASGDTFELVAIDDALVASNVVLSIERTAEVVDNIDVLADFRLLGGKTLRLFDASGVDNVEVRHDGTNLQVNDVSGTGVMRVRNMGVQIEDGQALRIQDATDTQYMEHSCDAVDGNTRFVGLVDWNIDINQALTGQIKIFTDTHLVSGAEFQMRDATNADTVTFSHNGVDLRVTPVNTTSFNLMAGLQMRINDATDTDQLILRHDGAHGRIITGGASLGLRLQLGSELAIDCTPNGAVDLYHDNVKTLRTADRNAADQCSGAEVLDSNGAWQPVGLGVMIDDATSWGSGTVNPFLQNNVGESIEQDNASSTNYDTFASTGSSQTDIPAGAWWFVTCSVANLTKIRGGTGVTLRAFLGNGATPVDQDVTVPNGGYAVVRKVSDSIYEVYGKGIF